MTTGSGSYGSESRAVIYRPDDPELILHPNAATLKTQMLNLICVDRRVSLFVYGGVEALRRQKK